MDEWISVKDKLPEKDGEYLCVMNAPFVQPYIKVRSYAHNLYSVDKYDFYNDKGESGFYRYDSEYGYCRANVSYWMQLPELPKEGW